MGIRIHKELGFILDEEHFKDIDNLDELMEQLDNLSGKVFSALLKDEGHLYKVDKERNLSGWFRMLDEEDGFESKKLVFYTVGRKEAKRYDDIVDYYDHGSNGADSSIKYLWTDIFPYVNRKITTAGIEIDKEDEDFVKMAANGFKFDANDAQKETRKRLEDKYQLDFSKDIKEQIYMKAPIDIQEMAKCLKLEDKINFIRPAIIVYWS